MWRSTVRVVAFDLGGSHPVNLPHLPALFTAGTTRWGRPVRQVRIVLNGGAIRTEAGALHMHMGNVTVDAAIGGAAG